jgi:crotonobetainyl-CoA:carnitine CoA-transferase CaiB-like acyl-CoA transferase
MARRPPPLDGVVVLDLSRVLAGPFAAMVLADLGARVIKVEDPQGGDMSRGWRPPEMDGESSYTLSVNRRKESAAVDFNSAPGVEFVRRWAAKADVLLENFLPGMLEKRGLSIESLRENNPRLVVVSLSGAGTVGPLAGEPGFDLLTQGAAGLMAITGPPDGEPCKTGVAVADVLAGWAVVVAALAGLAARARDGAGSHIATNLFSVALASLVNVAGGALVTGREARRYGNAHASIEPYRSFQARDGGFLLAVGTDRQFQILCQRVLSRPDIVADARFSTNQARVANRTVLVPLLNGLFVKEPREEWLARCRREGIPAGPITGVLEALRSPQAEALGTVLTTFREGHAPVPTVRPPFFTDDFRDAPPTAPPRLDEDGERLFAEVGLARTAR